MQGVSDLFGGGSSPLILLLSGILLGMVGGFLITRSWLFPRYKDLVDAKDKKRQQDFVAISSHYLLNPITVIQTATARLQEVDNLDAEARKHLYEAIVRGEQRLWITAEQLVLVNQLDDGKLTLQLSASDINDVVTGAIAAVDSFARQKNISIFFEDLTVGVSEARFDARRMKQAFIAILDNAVKFSVDGGEIKVSLKMEGQVWQVKIVDSGVGMAPDVMKQLTTRFFRGSSVYDFDYEGMGLGLFIARTILDMHGGIINVDSQPKRGTTVTIEFPKE